MSHNMNLLNSHFTISRALHSCESVNRKVNCGLTPTAPTRSAKATVKSMHMTRRRSVSLKLRAVVLILQLCISVF